MTKSEIKSLEKAFSIPEPKNKREFINIYKEKEKAAVRPKKFPIKIAAASTIAFAALLIGVWSNLKDNTNLKRHNDENFPVVIETEPTSDVTSLNYDSFTTAQNKAFVTTKNTSSDKNEIVTSTVASTAENSSNKTVSSIITSALTQKKTEEIITEQHYESDVTTARSESENITTTTKKKSENVTTTPQITTKAICATDEIIVTPVTTSKITNFNPQTSQTIEDPKFVKSGRDLTVVPENIYYPDNDVFQISDIKEADPKSSSYTPYSDEVIEGVVCDKIYTSINNVPYIQYDFNITNVIDSKDGLMEGDVISVFILGGYEPYLLYQQFSQTDYVLHDDCLIHDSMGNDTELFLGDSYLLLLESGMYGIPKGGYTIVGNTKDSVYTDCGENYMSIEDYSLIIPK